MWMKGKEGDNVFIYMVGYALHFYIELSAIAYK